MTTAGILNVGNELLAGEIANGNGMWLAERLTASGVAVREIRVVSDDGPAIERAVSGFADRFDHVVVTGGLGSTPDDVTLEAVANALERPLEVDPAARADIERTVREIERRLPEFDYDVDRSARYPVGSRPIPNEEGIVPGCVVENVYVFPGVPEEMKVVFERVEDEFVGDVRSRSVYSSVPESNLNPLLVELQERFDVGVGCYPGEKRKRITVTATDPERLEAAHEWLSSRPEVED
ncbi:competence/damage-inducible protein A [Natronobeatus ordinarius]|uniref:competence/damage-inducible protein A n=1 Tax=Natronobeatus ordinarius TaxID=2963433 RepID=UPI0020CC3FA4|nr:competence/damage-inducible protein A [Natronobeatus ordinarius]